MKKPLAVQLGEFVAALRFEDLPPAVIDKAKAFVNHALTVGMASFDAPRPTAARRAVLEQEKLGARNESAPVRAPRCGLMGHARHARRRRLRERRCDRGEQPVRLLPHAHASGRADHPRGTGDGRRRRADRHRSLLTALVAGYEVQCRCARDFIPSTTGARFSCEPDLRHPRLRGDDREAAWASTPRRRSTPSRSPRALPEASSRDSAIGVT